MQGNSQNTLASYW